MVRHTWVLADGFSPVVRADLVGLRFWGQVKNGVDQVVLKVGGQNVWECAYCAKAKVIKPHEISWPLFALDFHCMVLSGVAPPECRLSVHHIEQDIECMRAFKAQVVRIPISYHCNWMPEGHTQTYAKFSSGMMGS